MQLSISDYGNINLHLISRRFEVITDYCLNLVRKTVTLHF